MGSMALNVPDYAVPDWVKQSNDLAAKKRAEQAATSGANATIATGTAEGTYHAPMSAAELAASQLAQERQTSESTLATREQTFKESQALARQQALAGIAAQIQQTTGYSPAGGVPGSGDPMQPRDPGGPLPPVRYDPNDPARAAETATYGRAKERTGLAMQSALKGLRGAMASRGISGSGIEAAGTASVYGGGVGDLAETDRQMAEQGAGRAFTAGQSALDRAEQARQANMQAQAQRLSQLVQLYGSAY